MVDSILVLCDGAKSCEINSSTDVKRLNINQITSSPNLRLEIENLTHGLLKNVNEVCRDLLDIAAYVYYADTSIARGTNKDVFNQGWSRKFHFVIPVREPGLWTRTDIKTILVDLLEFLTEDKYEFEFVERDKETEQLILKGFDQTAFFKQPADSVLLFSGGMDALTGAVFLASSGRKPILVSHKPNQVIGKRQRKLASLLRQQFQGWVFPHIDLTVNRIGEEAIENTQRSRAFLFLALGTLVAHEMGLYELVVAENGITSMNLPRLGQTLGAQATRSTHPKTLALFRELIALVLDIDLHILTPFIWKTRAEEIELLANNKCEQMLEVSVSCNHGRRTILHPHCGTCSQCVDRRFATKFLRLKFIDISEEGFEKDIFSEPLADGEEWMQVESAVKLALEINRLDIDSFCKEFVQVFEALDFLPGDSDENLHRIFELHQQYAGQIIQVIDNELHGNWPRIIRNELQVDCLLMRAFSGNKFLSQSALLEQAKSIIEEIQACFFDGKNEPYEDICQKVLTFLFCQNVPKAKALDFPIPQSENDQGYNRRDLVFPNWASEGLWAEVKRDYHANGIVADAKNYSECIDGMPVHDIAMYLKDRGLGMFGILVARKVPIEAKSALTKSQRPPAAIKAQVDEWQNNSKMIVLLDDDDLIEMVNLKAQGKEPTSLIQERIFTMRSRV